MIHALLVQVWSIMSLINVMRSANKAGMVLEECTGGKGGGDSDSDSDSDEQTPPKQ